MSIHLTEEETIIWQQRVKKQTIWLWIITIVLIIVGYIVPVYGSLILILLIGGLIGAMIFAFTMPKIYYYVEGEIKE